MCDQVKSREIHHGSGIVSRFFPRRGRKSTNPPPPGRLSGALGISLSALVARAERDESPIARRGEQPVWVDPASRYVRRALSPRPGGRLELVEIELPAGTVVGYPSEAALAAEQQIWLIEGDLVVREDDREHRLARGDCLELRPGTARVFRTDDGCRYLVAYAR
ncbi:MAG TPA: cupin domain-containing protein [Solirubrobacteraceae bacterium]|nr:cupin domain-containing protein [Solirubrobacteraceae bacterium]